MSHKQLFATLNILYLKMCQYEKYLNLELTNTVFEGIDKGLRYISDQHDPERVLKRMQLVDMVAQSGIYSKFYCYPTLELIKSQLLLDLIVVNELLERTLSESEGEACRSVRRDFQGVVERLRQ